MALRNYFMPSTLVLIASNMMVLYGLLFLGWGVFAMIFLFWMENLIIGAFNVLKMVLNRPGEAALWFGKLFMIPFFIVHYGMFTAVHGLFVLELFGPEPVKKMVHSPFESGPYLYAIEHGHFSYMLAFLIFSHTFSFVTNYIMKEEYETTTLQRLMSAPYGRVVVLHLTVLFGGFLLLWLGSPLAGLVLLLGLKIVFDVLAHAREHRKAEA